MMLAERGNKEKVTTKLEEAEKTICKIVCIKTKLVKLHVLFFSSYT